MLFLMQEAFCVVETGISSVLIEISNLRVYFYQIKCSLIAFLGYFVAVRMNEGVSFFPAEFPFQAVVWRDFKRH